MTLHDLKSQQCTGNVLMPNKVRKILRGLKKNSKQEMTDKA